MSNSNMSGPTSLDRLAEMVRQAEAKTRAQKLGSETRQAAEALRIVEARAREAEGRLREQRPILQRALATANEDEQRLKDLIRKVAVLKGTAALGPDEGRALELEIDNSRAEIETRRKATQEALEAVQRESGEARRALEAATERYQDLRRELDRLQPQLAPDFGEADRLARSAESLTPAGQVRALAREVDAATAHFDMLEPREQLAQLTLWIGRFRRLQALESANLTEEEQTALQRIFPRLVGISKQYEPGYIEAFRANFHTDWDAYVTDAEQMLQQATEAARLRRETEQRRREQAARVEDRRQQARADAQSAMDELKAVLARFHLPEEGLDEFYEALDRVIAGYGANDDDLIELVTPYRDLLTGSEYRALRKHLDRARQDDGKEVEALHESFKDVLEQTRGKKALMMGGSAREEMRRTLERVFEFDELDWESYEDKRPALLESIKQRIKNRSIDLVLLLKSFLGHHVTEQLRPLCEQSGVSCVMVEHGYGPAQVADTLRRLIPARTTP